MIVEAIKNGVKGTSTNMRNNAPCSVYTSPGINNQYVVIENGSGNIVQVSRFHDTNWVPDSRIIWDP